MLDFAVCCRVMSLLPSTLGNADSTVDFSLCLKYLGGTQLPSKVHDMEGRDGMAPRWMDQPRSSSWAAWVWSCLLLRGPEGGYLPVKVAASDGGQYTKCIHPLELPCDCAPKRACTGIRLGLSLAPIEPN